MKRPADDEESFLVGQIFNPGVMNGRNYSRKIKLSMENMGASPRRLFTFFFLVSSSKVSPVVQFVIWAPFLLLLLLLLLKQKPPTSCAILVGDWTSPLSHIFNVIAYLTVEPCPHSLHISCLLQCLPFLLFSAYRRYHRLT